MKFTLNLHDNHNFAFTFDGDTYTDNKDADVAAMLAAIREGLEANGYNVTITVSVETEMAL
jgi:hypothetical protein